MTTAPASSTWGVSPPVRRTLARFVLDSRRDLEDDFRRQLASIGVHADRVDDLATARKLEADEELAREAAIAVVDRVVAAGGSREGAFETFVRDSAFTFLNRVVGLRCLEERGMLLVGEQRDTAIRVDERLRASSLYFRVRNELPADASPRTVWRETLEKAFRAVSERVGLLFEPHSEYGRLFPLQPTLALIVDGLNDPTIPGATWGDDEVLGWIYQYYSSEEKDNVYDKLRHGGKIERPEELAAASCLYTERYMVDFLLQNTLGALWVEMRPETSLPDGWAYYVKRSAPAQGTSEERAPKRLRDVTILDPAVGSGHFHARAFDLLVEMYQEEGLEDPAEIPQLILERNLHGIDIDLRAVQITALRLYLKGCETGGPNFRPRRLNLVSADIALPAAPPAEFVARFSGDQEVQDLIKGSWSQLNEAPRLGALLHPERRVDEVLTRRRQEGDNLLQQDDRAWERFKLDLLDGIRDEFDKEAHSEDIGRRLFGQDAAKGVSLVEALVRRYDVIVTNPPYAGSRNLDEQTKRFVEHEYRDGKRDLYAAFILRNLEFARIGGFVGMVTQQAWLFLRSFVKLRAGILRNTSVTTLAHLGPRGFDEIGGEVVNVALFALRKTSPAADHRMTAFRLVGPTSPAAKDRLLRRAIAGDAGGLVSTPTQADLRSIPETPFVYWLRPRFFELLRSSHRLSDLADVRQGLATADNDRFIRCFWEVNEIGGVRAGEPASGRWFWYGKGGRYQKWAGLEWLVVDWASDGRAIKEFVVTLPGTTHWSRRVSSRPYYFKDGLTYTLMARGSIGARLLRESIFDVASISIFVDDVASRPAVAAIVNARLASFLLRVTTQDLKFQAGYAANLPVPRALDRSLGLLAQSAFTLKEMLVIGDPTERAFRPGGLLSPPLVVTPSTSLLDVVEAASRAGEATAALLHSLEGWNDQLVCDSYELGCEDVSRVIEETGTPAGWHPLIADYDEVVAAPAGVQLPGEFRRYLGTLERRTLPFSELVLLKARIRSLYEAGPGGNPADDGSNLQGDDEEESALGAHIPIPTETLLEELSVKVGVHPVSVLRLLDDMRESEGIKCAPEIRRTLEEHVSVTLLLLLGYRWPDQNVHDDKGGHAVDADLVDSDGIIPLVPSGDHATAAERIRSVLERRFGEEGAARSLEEFRVWTGRDLDAWLRRDFFRRHMQQFKQRPIAWHVTSREGTFQCLLLYQRLSRDTLRRLSDVYAGALINHLKAELEQAQSRGDAGAASQLRLQIEDVEDFRDRVLAVEQGRELASRIRCRWKEEEQEGRLGPYAPDIDDGVKVNIRPFQETGLLSREVIKKW